VLPACVLGYGVALLIEAAASRPTLLVPGLRCVGAFAGGDAAVSLRRSGTARAGPRRARAARRLWV
jgi:hypothetical protein